MLGDRSTTLWQSSCPSLHLYWEILNWHHAFKYEQKADGNGVAQGPALGVLITNLLMASLDLLNANQLPSFPTVAVEN